LYESEPEATGRIVTVIAEALIQQTFKYYLDITFRIADKDVDLQGHPDGRATTASKYAQLLTWSESPAGVLVRTQSSITDNKYYKLDPLSLKMINRVTRENRSYIVARARLYQLS
jgi:hypothetical protein